MPAYIRANSTTTIGIQEVGLREIDIRLSGREGVQEGGYIQECDGGCFRSRDADVELPRWWVLCDPQPPVTSQAHLHCLTRKLYSIGLKHTEGLRLVVLWIDRIPIAL